MKLPFDIESGQFQGLKSRQYTITIEAWLELPWNSRGADLRRRPRWCRNLAALARSSGVSCLKMVNMPPCIKV